MGTRCLTVLMGSKNRETAVLYRQMDGYPDGHGLELAEYLEGSKLVNGIPIGVDSSKMFNGLDCMAASIVAHFKTGTGGFYLMPAGTRDVWEDYVYIVSGEEGKEPTITVEDNGFSGPASEYKAWLKKLNEEEE